MPKKKEKKYMGKNTQDVIKFNQSQFKGINGKNPLVPFIVRLSTETRKEKKESGGNKNVENK